MYVSTMNTLFLFIFFFFTSLLVHLCVSREATMAGLCRALYKTRSLPEDLNQYIADFEEKTFQTAKDMVYWFKQGHNPRHMRARHWCSRIKLKVNTQSFVNRYLCGSCQNSHHRCSYIGLLIGMYGRLVQCAMLAKLLQNYWMKLKILTPYHN